jgi:Kdo2-lipid IVA lauroyltransferase/acyltransferase
LGKLFFHITVTPFFFLLSILPMPVLYVISSCLYVPVYYLFSYRKKVVLDNLRHSFPEMNEDQICALSRRFYRHFCDLLVETIKLMTVSASAQRKRCVFDQPATELLNRYVAEKKSVIAVMGHCGNWEWACIAYQLYFDRTIAAAYHPLSNPHFDKLLFRLRTRFGADFIPMKNLLRKLIEFRRRSQDITVGLIADQTAPPESAYWTTFLHRDAAFFNGPEKLAVMFGYPVIYFNVHKTSRGYYRISASVITENPGEPAPGEISDRFVALLESNIREQPHTWLWTHRRWKHKKPLV